MKSNRTFSLKFFPATSLMLLAWKFILDGFRCLQCISIFFCALVWQILLSCLIWLKCRIECFWDFWSRMLQWDYFWGEDTCHSSSNCKLDSNRYFLIALSSKLLLILFISFWNSSSCWNVSFVLDLVIICLTTFFSVSYLIDPHVMFSCSWGIN